MKTWVRTIPALALVFAVSTGCTPGSDGDRGPAGPQGESGRVGVQGEPGPPGRQGDPGPIGAQGPQGIQGAVGPRGPAGASADAEAVAATIADDEEFLSLLLEAFAVDPPESLIGPAGPQGQAGEAGSPGPQGEPGPIGAMGVDGPAGPPGEAGPVGASGPPGPPCSLMDNENGTATIECGDSQVQFRTDARGSQVPCTVLRRDDELSIECAGEEQCRVTQEDDFIVIECDDGTRQVVDGRIEAEERVLEGSFTVEDEVDLQLLRPYTHVTGDLAFYGPEVPTALLPNLTQIGGSLRIDNVSTVSTMEFPALSTVGENIQIRGNPGVLSINLSSLEQVGGRVDILSMFAIDEVNLPALVSADVVRVNACPAVTAVRLPSLESTGSDFILNGLNRLRTLDAPVLGSVGGLLQLHALLTLERLELPMLSTVGGELSATSNANLTDFDLWALEEVSDSLVGVNNERLPQCLLDALRNRVLLGSFRFSGNRSGCTCMLVEDEVIAECD
jgi:hypothetical protein